MTSRFHFFTAASAALLALSVAVPLSTQVAGASSDAAIVTVNSVDAYGAVPNLTGLPVNSPYVSIRNADGMDLSGQAQGTLTCGTNANALSNPGTYEVMDCSGITVPGDSVIYDITDSHLTILRHSYVIGLINRYLAPGTTVELNPQPLPPGSVIDFSWAAHKCNGALANPGVTVVPLINGQQASTEAPMAVPCRAHKNGQPAGHAGVTGFNTASGTYAVHDYCMFTDPKGITHHYLSFLPVGCQIQKTVAVYNSGIDSGANLYLSHGGFTGGTLVSEAPIAILGGSYSAATGSVSVSAGDDDDFCGTRPRIPIPLPPHCVGDTIEVRGVTPAVFNGTFKITGVSGDTLTYNFNGQAPAGAQLNGGTFQLGAVALSLPKGGNTANVVLNGPGLQG